MLSRPADLTGEMLVVEGANVGGLRGGEYVYDIKKDKTLRIILKLFIK